MRPKILLVIDHTEAGGAQVVVQQLIENLGQTFAFSVAVMGRSGRFSKVYDDLGIPVWEIGGRRGRWNLFALVDLVKVIQRGGYDLIHTHLLKSNILGALAARYVGRKVLLHDHSSVSPQLMKLYFPTFVLRYAYLSFYWFTLRICNRVIVLTPAAKEYIQLNYPMTTAKLAVVPNGVDLLPESNLNDSIGSSIRCELGLAGDTRLIVMAGRLEREKDWITFLKVAEQVPSCTELRCAFLVIGVGSEEAHLRSYVAESKLNTVHFLGYRSDVCRLLSGSDVLLLTSQFEPFGIVVLEAMVAGCPVVATRSGGPDSILTHEVNGLLAEVGDADALSKHVIRVLNDCYLRKSLIRSARRTVTRFYTTEVFSARMAAIYNQLLQGSKNLPRVQNATS
jgi:glycosyltransferase involved in cell wall biosynthesis